MLYTIGEMADKLGVPASTLRFYDKQGLLPFVERSAGGIRMFKESDYEWLKIIECLKKSGLQLKEIRDFIRMAMLGDETIGERLELFYRRRDAIKKQLEELKETLEIVEFKCWYYETAKAAGTTAEPDNMPEEALPLRLRGVRKRIKHDA